MESSLSLLMGFHARNSLFFLLNSSPTGFLRALHRNLLGAVWNEIKREPVTFIAAMTTTMIAVVSFSVIVLHSLICVETFVHLYTIILICNFVLIILFLPKFKIRFILAWIQNMCMWFIMLMSWFFISRRYHRTPWN